MSATRTALNTDLPVGHLAKPRPPLGRPRAFDSSAALAAALDLFWAQGYAASSVDDLTATMGISRSSFYNVYTSKHAILLAAVALYIDDHLARLEAAAGAEPTPALAARAVLRQVADAQGGRRGCFLVNCITELAPHDDALAALGRLHLDRVEALLRAILIQAGTSHAHAAPHAAGLLAAAMGATVLRKAGLAPDRIDAILDTAFTLIP